MRLKAALGLILLALLPLAPARSSAERNILLITIDTIRADALSCNGSTEIRTPNLDRLAAEGANFTRARSPVPLTLPAHASILTGNYPPTHSVRTNGEFQLPGTQESLAEVLADRGFQTAAFVSSFVLDRRFGLNQGFELYDDRVWSAVDELEELEAERTGREVFSAFASWLRDYDDSSPFFVWIHLYDPHAPYEPPEPFRSRYPENPYGGEVAYVDSIIGEILAELQTAKHLSKTLVAVTGDHGEGLGEHGEVTHSLLIYNSTLHVPMMIWAPGTVAAGRRIDDLVRVIDLAPTLLDLLDLSDGLGEGVSLRKTLEKDSGSDQEEGLDLTAYSESYYPESALGWSPLLGLEVGHYRLIQAPRTELYHVLEDPGETRNRVDSEPGEYQRLKRQLAAALDEFERHSASTEPSSLDAASREKMASLGYLSASGARTGRRDSLLDPKEKIELWNRIQQGIFQLGRGDYRSAIHAFETVLQEDPDNPLVYEYLGMGWRRLGDDKRAEEVYLQAVNRGLASTRLHSELGRLKLERGEIEGAERELRAALALDPRSVVIHYDLATLYRKRGEYPRAIEHYTAAVEINPDYLWGWNGLGMVLAAQGESEEALAAFERVVAIDPQGAQGTFNLAVHLERSGLGERALEVYGRFLDLSAGNVTLGEQRRQAQAAIDRLSP